MPLQNRVTPFAEIIVTPARGTLYGNRGVLHDEHGTIVRGWQVRRWIACVLEFKDRRRPLLRPGRFTELFFLDEATALAAGHRPCAECRRADYVRFLDAWPGPTARKDLRADDVDRVLHAERVAEGGRKRIHPGRMSGLPDGAMVAEDGRAWLVLGDELLAWSPFGYDDRRARPRSGTANVLTPPSILAAIRAGYPPALHPSARPGP